MFDIRTIDLRALNSMTGYPSIPTYHDLDPANGALKETGLRDRFVELDATVCASEKVNGANGRIIYLPDGSYIIGSRDELLYRRGDIVANPKLGIVEALRPIAEQADRDLWNDENIVVCYLEVYGGKKITPASRNYTSGQQLGARLFDVVEVHADEHAELLTQPVERIASWRQHGGQQFWGERQLYLMADELSVPPTPRLGRLSPTELPTTVEETHEWLERIVPHTLASLEDGLLGPAEGVVLRTDGRGLIAKVRFENYRRTAQVRGGAR
ncbi:hypothetical protein E1091_05765 [Micromonospora fluostatini]|uniref:RNA ligase domain-containing protein n=1 Tax=Micromonospora fluostatini TaxID=1629071 RepID=A0ABY2DP30_9ACTN|nr:hypothetical protein E1091_05765 [Micromonospora fluostatini]